MKVQLGSETYRFLWWHEAPQASYNPYGPGPAMDARLELMRFKAHADALRRFREMLAGFDWGLPAAMLDDDEVIEQFAWRLQTGQIQMQYEIELRESSLPTELIAPAQPVDETPPKSAPVPEPPPEPEEPTFGPTAELAAIIGVLKKAAQAGTPFCEECAKAAAKKAAAAGPTPVFEPRPLAKDEEPSAFADNSDLILLAKMQKEAAELGVPFCEECAKAAAKRQKAEPSGEAPVPFAPKPLSQDDAPSEFAENADLVRLAATQKQAAITGAPFCEECAKAAAKRQPAPSSDDEPIPFAPKPLSQDDAPSEFSNTADLVQLAAMQKKAAIEGASFCEECAKAAATPKEQS